MFLPQEFIHRLEQGAFSRFVQLAAVGLAIAAIAFAYNLRAFKNLSTQEGMDAAQLARNLAEGRGFVTDNISPLSIHLVKQRQAERIAAREAAGAVIVPQDFMDQARLRNNHPDLNNPPLYPWLLSLYLRVVPLEYSINPTAVFERYRPDLLIAIFNQLLLVACAGLVFALARRLFDGAVAWTSLVLFVGTSLFWQVSVSGQSTLLLMCITLALMWSLLRFEQGTSLDGWTGSRPVWMALLIGLLLALGFLTRYAFGWLLLPVLMFLALYGGSRRFAVVFTALMTFVILATPWVQRNLKVSGKPFGAAGYAVYQLTDKFPGDEIPRTLQLDVSSASFPDYARKFRNHAREMLQDDLPRLGGTWMTAFFFVGLMVVFRRPSLNRFRGLLLVMLGVLFVAQALGKTQLSLDSPVVNTENLLILLAPAMIIFGVSFFFTLLDQWNIPEFGIRVLLTGMLCGLVSLPLVFTLLARTYAVAYPPYFPPVIQLTSNWLRDGEQMMSDVPWAVAWYGRRQCIRWTLDPDEDFYSIYDYDKPINALYLSPGALDRRLLSQLLKGPGAEWGRPFLVDVIARKEIPKEFPLKYAPPRYFWPQSPENENADEEKPEHLFLSDRIRW